MAKNKYEKLVEPRKKEIVELCRQGGTDIDISNLLGISRSTFYNYIKKYPEFDKFITNARASSYEKIENEMFQNAIGRDVEEETIEYGADGKIRSRKIVKKHIVGDLSSQKFILQNRQRERWNQPESQINITNENKLDLSQFSKDELLRIIGEED